MENLKDVILRLNREDLVRDAVVSECGIYRPGDPQEALYARLLEEIAETRVKPDRNLILVGWYGWFPNGCPSGTREPGVEVGLFLKRDLLAFRQVPEWDRIDTVLDNPNVEPGRVAFEHLRYEDIRKLEAFSCRVWEIPWPREMETVLSASVAPGVDEAMIGEVLSRILGSKDCPQAEGPGVDPEKCRVLFSPRRAACRTCRGCGVYTEISRYHRIKEAAAGVLAEMREERPC